MNVSVELKSKFKPNKLVSANATISNSLATWISYVVPIRKRGEEIEDLILAEESMYLPQQYLIACPNSL